MSRKKTFDILMWVALATGFIVALVTANTGNALIFAGLSLVSQAHFFKKIKRIMIESGRLVYLIGLVWALIGVPTNLPLALGWASVFLTLLVGTYVE